MNHDEYEYDEAPGARAISMMDEWKEVCAVLQEERDEALSVVEAEVRKSNRLERELVSARNKYEAHVAMLEHEIEKIKDTLAGKSRVVKTLKNNAQEEARVAASNIQNYEHQIAELQKALILSQIKKHKTLPSDIKSGAAPDGETRAEVDAANEIRITQLVEENNELTQQINNLYLELEDLKSQRMEKMECSFTSPIRKSLGTAFAALNIDQRDSVSRVFRGNQENFAIRSREWEDEEPLHSTPMVSRAKCRDAIHETSELWNDDESLEGPVFHGSEASAQLNVSTKTRVAMRVGAIILGSIALIPHMS